MNETRTDRRGLGEEREERYEIGEEGEVSWG